MADLFPLADLQALVGSVGFDSDLGTAARDVATGVALGRMRLLDVPDPAPLALVGIVKRAAARLYANPTDLKTETVGGSYSASYSALFDAVDLAVLDFVASQSGSGRAMSVTLGF